MYFLSCWYRFARGGRIRVQLPSSREQYLECAHEVTWFELGIEKARVGWSGIEWIQWRFRAIILYIIFFYARGVDESGCKVLLAANPVRSETYSFFIYFLTIPIAVDEGRLVFLYWVLLITGVVTVPFLVLDGCITTAKEMFFVNLWVWDLEEWWCWFWSAVNFQLTSSWLFLESLED